MSDKELFAPFSTDIDLIWGIMKDPDNHIIRRASDLRGYYSDAAALEDMIRAGDPILYEVFEKKIPEQHGHLQFCISLTRPGTVGEEFYLTKGHYHELADTAEIYLCLRGSGYMVMKTSARRSAVERFLPGRIVYVPPYWAHRTVNTGEEPLISFCVYPGDAGHNYGDVEKEGFSIRVFNRGGKVEIVQEQGNEAQGNL